MWSIAFKNRYLDGKVLLKTVQLAVNFTLGYTNITH